MPPRILLVDDNTLFRQGLRALFSAISEFVVVADVADSAAGYNEALRNEPDLIIMDIMLPGRSALDFAAKVKRRLPRLHLLVLTSQGSEEHLRDALMMGADGYVQKDTSFSDLLTAIRSVLAGRKYISPTASAQLVEGYLNPLHAGRRDSPLSMLTNRERSILKLVASGRSNRTAAEALRVSAKTVEKHRASLMRKLGLSNSAELLMVAVEMGLIEKPGSVSRLVAPHADAAP
jgi:DNA-binding NarL/FixJ family response regulator